MEGAVPPPPNKPHKGGQINGGPCLQCKKKCNPYVKRKITRSGHRTFATPSHFINVIMLFSCDPMIILLLQNIKPRYVLISIYIQIPEINGFELFFFFSNVYVDR